MVVWLRKIEWRIKDALQSLRGRIDRSLFDAIEGPRQHPIQDSDHDLLDTAGGDVSSPRRIPRGVSDSGMRIKQNVITSCYHDSIP